VAIKSDGKVSLRNAIYEINKLKHAAMKQEELSSMVTKIVETFESFGSKLPGGPDTDRCLMRIRFWLQNPNGEVDVVQEIDFLLGLVIREDVSAVTEVEFVDEIPNFDDDVIRQLRYLRQSICELKEQNKANEEERKAFISRNLRHKLPSSARWPQICEYILSHK
jgi:hypothetical protein